MISRRTYLVVLAVLALASCSTPEQRAERALQDATDTMNAAATDAMAAAEQVIRDEFRVVKRSCDLRAATATLGMEGVRLSLPAELYAAREQEPTASQIACVARWAAENHYDLIVVEARN